MRSLAVFAKWPAPGRVKTRLSPALPAELSCRLARGLLIDTLEAMARASADRRVLFLDGGPNAASMAEVWDALIAAQGIETPEPGSTEGFELARQGGGDLGARLEAALALLLRSSADRAVVVGTDAPDLDAALVASAFDRLEHNDLVIGPTSDQGYYLIGLSRAVPALFRGVPWSTERVLLETLATAREQGLEAALLPELEDVDTPADLIRWVARSAIAPRASRAVDVLRAIHLLPTPSR